MKNEQNLKAGWYDWFLNQKQEIKTLIIVIFLLLISLLLQLPYGPLIFSLTLIGFIIYFTINYKKIKSQISRQQEDPRIRNATKMVLFLAPIWIVIFVFIFATNDVTYGSA